MSTTWGAPIAKGSDVWPGPGKPVWLGDDEPVLIGWGSDEETVRWSNPHAWTAKSVTKDAYEGRGWAKVKSIRLPASRPAYTVLAWNAAHPDQPPFFPWSGGEAEPLDWDGKSWLYRDGYAVADADCKQPGRLWEHGGDDLDIIGYRRATPASTPAPLDEAAQAAIALVERMANRDSAPYFMAYTEARRIANLPSFPKAVDPLLVEAREIAALEFERADNPSSAEQARIGTYDAQTGLVSTALAALRRGIEIGERKA